MAYLNHYAMATSTNFHNQLVEALAAAANSIQSEAAGTQFHVQRQALAHEVCQDPASWANRMAYAVVEANVNLKTAADTGGAAGPWSPADTDIDTAIGAVWNLFAGINT